MKKQTKTPTGNGAVDDQSAAIAGPAQPRTDTKQSKLIELLQREQGASLAEMQEATGWLAHTTRAALTGLRKRGITIEKTKLGGETRYKAVAAQ